MYIRPATLADVPAIAEIGSKAFGEDPLYTQFFPWRSKYPQDFYSYFEEEIRTTLVSVGELIMVAEIDDADQLSDMTETLPGSSTKGIVAYAIFVRCGSPKELAQWNPDSLLKKLRRVIYFLRSYWESIFFPNRAIYLPAIEEYRRKLYAIYDQHTDPKTGRIEFDTLAVHPAYQNRGYGEKLAEYGSMRTWEEGLTGLGESIQKNVAWYVRGGCEEVGKIVMPERTIDVAGKSEAVTKLDKIEISVLKWRA